MEKSPVGRWLLNAALGGQLRQFADNMATFNTELVTRGLAEASTALCARYGGKVVAEGLLNVPTDGPLLLVSNHPGMFDTLAIYATLPRSDIRALARPQPLLGLLSSLAPYLLMLPGRGSWPGGRAAPDPSIAAGRRGVADLPGRPPGA